MRIPVMYREQDGEVTAVFPTLRYRDDNDSDDVTCYAHIGQHSAASWGWIAETRGATPKEYADLHKELTGIYHDAELIVIAG